MGCSASSVETEAITIKEGPPAETVQNQIQETNEEVLENLIEPPVNDGTKETSSIHSFPLINSVLENAKGSRPNSSSSRHSHDSRRLKNVPDRETSPLARPLSISSISSKKSNSSKGHLKISKSPSASIKSNASVNDKAVNKKSSDDSDAKSTCSSGTYTILEVDGAPPTKATDIPDNLKDQNENEDLSSKSPSRKDLENTELPTVSEKYKTDLQISETAIEDLVEDQGIGFEKFDSRLMEEKFLNSMNADHLQVATPKLSARLENLGIKISDLGIDETDNPDSINEIPEVELTVRNENEEQMSDNHKLEETEENSKSVKLLHQSSSLSGDNIKINVSESGEVLLQAENAISNSVGNENDDQALPPWLEDRLSRSQSRNDGSTAVSISDLLSDLDSGEEAPCSLAASSSGLVLPRPATSRKREENAPKSGNSHVPAISSERTSGKFIDKIEPDAINEINDNIDASKGSETEESDEQTGEHINEEAELAQEQQIESEKVDGDNDAQLSEEQIKEPQNVTQLYQQQTDETQNDTVLSEVPLDDDQNVTQLSEEQINESRNVTHLSEEHTEESENVTQLSEEQTEASQNVTQLSEEQTEESENVTQLSGEQIDETKNIIQVPNGQVKDTYNNAHLSEERTEESENVTQLSEERTEESENVTQLSEERTEESQNVTQLSEEKIEKSQNVTQLSEEQIDETKNVIHVPEEQVNETHNHTQLFEEQTEASENVTQLSNEQIGETKNVIPHFEEQVKESQIVTQLSEEQVNDSQNVTQLPEEQTEESQNVVTQLYEDQSDESQDITQLSKELIDDSHNVTQLSEEQVNESQNVTRLSEEQTEETQNVVTQLSEDQTDESQDITQLSEEQIDDSHNVTQLSEEQIKESQRVIQLFVEQNDESHNITSLLEEQIEESQNNDHDSGAIHEPLEKSCTNDKFLNDAQNNDNGVNESSDGQNDETQIVNIDLENQLQEHDNEAQSENCCTDEQSIHALSDGQNAEQINVDIDSGLLEELGQGALNTSDKYNDLVLEPSVESSLQVNNPDHPEGQDDEGQLENEKEQRLSESPNNESQKGGNHLSEDSKEQNNVRSKDYNQEEKLDKEDAEMENGNEKINLVAEDKQIHDEENDDQSNVKYITEPQEKENNLGEVETNEDLLNEKNSSAEVSESAATPSEKVQKIIRFLLPDVPENNKYSCGSPPCTRLSYGSNETTTTELELNNKEEANGNGNLTAVSDEPLDENDTKDKILLDLSREVSFKEPETRDSEKISISTNEESNGVKNPICNVKETSGSQEDLFRSLSRQSVNSMTIKIGDISNLSSKDIKHLSSLSSQKSSHNLDKETSDRGSARAVMGF